MQHRQTKSTNSPSAVQTFLLRTPLSIAVGGLALTVAAIGCARDSAAVERHPPVSSAADTLETSVLASIGDQRITMSDLRDKVGDQLDQLNIQYRRTRDKLVAAALDTVIRDRLFEAEAHDRGKSVADLIAAEISGGAEPTDSEVTAWYKGNPDRVTGRSLDQVRGQISDLLRKQRRGNAIRKLEDGLRDKRKVTLNFEPYRLQFANAGAPTRGSSHPRVTLVEFSDFQCPYCRATAPTLREVEKKYGDRVQIVYRQFPLTSIHPFAFKAAEASLCANEQGKFWEMHDAMFEDQTKLGVSDLKQTARRLGVDGKKFDSCIDTGRYVERVQNDQKEGQRDGVNGTPAMFLNGKYVEGGSVPFSVLDQLIQEELARGKSGS